MSLTNGLPTLTVREITEIALTKPKNREELWNYVRVLFNISLPRHAVKAGCTAPFDAFASAYFGETSSSVWVGARGTTKTFMAALLAACWALTCRVDTMIIAGSQDQATQAINYLRNRDTGLASAKVFWSAPNAPVWLIDETADAKTSWKTIGGLNGDLNFPPVTIFAVPASEEAIRGKHPCKLIYDEVDLADWKTVESSRPCPKEANGQLPHVLYCSTYHVYGGTMARLIKEAQEQGWKLSSWTWREVMIANGGYMTNAFIREQRGRMSKAQWDLEYENNGPQGGTRVFDKDHLDILFDPSLGTWPGIENEWCLIYPEKVPPVRFYTGIDWAKKLHWTVIHSWQKVGSNFVTAAWYRTNQKPYPQIVGEAVNHLKTYKGLVGHDATGVGTAMDDFLIDGGISRTRITPFDWTRKKTVQEMAARYRHGVEDGKLRGPLIEWARSEHEYLTEEMLQGSDHCPDSVSAAMMGYFVASQKPGSGKSGPRFLHIPG